MYHSIEVDPIVLKLAADAEYVVNIYDESSIKKIEFSAGLGEIRYLLYSMNGTVRVNFSERLEPDYLVFAAPSVDTVARFMLKTFGSVVRQRRKLPRIRIPADPGELEPGLRLVRSRLEGEERLALEREDGSIVAWGDSDPTVATIALVTLSHSLSASLNDIADSYRDPSGAPLFARFVVRK